ncbi:MAG: hypothetical protein ACR2KW_00780 [Rubrobacter sp.]
MRVVSAEPLSPSLVTLPNLDAGREASAAFSSSSGLDYWVVRTREAG